MRPLLRALTFATLTLACGAGVAESDIHLAPGSWPGHGGLPPTHATVVVEPGEGTELQQTGHPRPPVGLGLLEGRVVIGDAAGLWTAIEDDSLDLGPADIRGEAGVPLEISSVTALGQRASGGLLVAAREGLLHSFEHSFFRSPLSDAVRGLEVRSVHASGGASSETLWLTLPDRTEILADGKRWGLKLDGLPAAAFAVGITAGQGFLSVGDDLYQVQVSPPRATLRIAGVGPVSGALWRGEALVMSAAGGLVEARPDGKISVTAFQGPSGTALPVRAVADGAGALHVLAGESLLRASGATFHHVAEIPGAQGTLAVDAWGQAWVGTATGLVRVRTGERVTFAQVESFFIEHCIRCHDGGAEGAPVIDFLDPAVAQTWAPRVLARVSDAQSPMPPRRVEVLYPEDWTLVRRWVEGGALP